MRDGPLRQTDMEASRPREIPRPALAPRRLSASPTGVSDVLPASRAQSQSITPAQGGSVEATGADGSRFVLTIPAGALPHPQTITLVPVISAGGLPFSGGLAAGVDMRPEGLRLVTPATLTITPARAVPVRDQIAFSTRGDGAELHMVPLPRDPARIEIQVMHFSTGQLAAGTAADRSAMVEQHPPTGGVEQYQQQAAQVLADLRTEVLAGNPTAELANELAPIYAAMYRDVVKPHLLAAAADDRQIVSVANTYFSWVRSLFLLGLANDSGQPASEFDDEIAEAQQLLWAAVRTGLARASERCVAEKDLSQVERMAEIVAIARALGHEELMAEYPGRAAACLSFEMTFDASISWRSGDEVSASRVKGVVPFSIDPRTGRDLLEETEGILKYESFQYAWQFAAWTPLGTINCTFAPAGTRDGRIGIWAARFDVFRASAEPDQNWIDVELFDGPRRFPKPTEIVRQTCTGPVNDPILDEVTKHWAHEWYVYNIILIPEFFGGDHVFRFPLTRQAGAVIARSEHHRTPLGRLSGTYENVTLIEVRHAPLPFASANAALTRAPGASRGSA